MVSNKRPFGRPVSLGSDYSSERSISPQLLSFDIEDRISSPESVVLETEQWLFMSSEHVILSPDFHEMRSSSPKSMESITAHCLLPPHSPVPEFRQGISEISMASDKDLETEVLLSMSFEDRPSSPVSVASVNEYKALPPDSPTPQFSYNLPDSAIEMKGERSSSPESVCSDVEYGSMSPTSLSHETRALSPVSVASGDESESVVTVIEHRIPSPESTESAQRVCHSILADHRPKSIEPLVFDTENKPPTPEELVCEHDDGWVIINLSDIEERPLSPESVSDYRPISSQSAMLDIRASSPESSHECLSPDSPIPQHMPFVPQAVTVNDHSSSPESVLSYTEYETVTVLSYLENRPLSPDSSGSISDYGPLTNPVTYLPPEENVELKYTTQATGVLEETCIEKQFEEKSHVIFDLEKLKYEETKCVLSKSVEENPEKYGETEAPKIQSDVPCCGQSDTVTPPAEAEVLSTDVITEELSHELFNEGKSVTKKTKSAKRRKSNNAVKIDYEPVQNIREYQKESSEFISKTHKETQASDQTVSLPLSLESASDDLPLSLAFPPNVPEDQQTPRESLVSVPQLHVPLCSVPVYSLSYDVDLWKLISQIRDPQYVGETFMSKREVFQFAETRNESYQAHSDGAAGDETASLQSENDQRTLSPDSESEYRPMSPESLRVLESFRSDSSHSGRSVDSQQALSADSPVPQFLNSFSGPSQVYHRSVSSESVLSDLELETDLNISCLFEDRPASTDSVSSINIYSALSPDSPIPEFRQFLPESVLSVRLDWSSSLQTIASDLECGTSCLSLLLSESRLSSPDSVDVNRPLSPESPIPVFSQALPEFAVSATLEMSSSPVSVCSDLEYGTTALSQLCSEVRRSSPDSVFSEDDYRGDLLGSSPKSLVSDVEYAQSSEDIVISEQRPDSPDSRVPETTERVLGDCNQTLKAIQVPVFRLVYDAELWKLISQICDPHYVGETYCSKTGVFEYAGTRTEYVREDSGVTEDGMKLDIADSSDADVLQAAQAKHEREGKPVSEYRPSSHGELTFRSECPESMKDLSPDSPVPQFSIDLANISQSVPNSQQSAVSDEESDWFCNEIRPSSASSPISLDENRVLSPDSPLPDFTPAVPESVTAVFGSRSSSPQSVLSDIKYQFSASEDFTCQRADSPESVAPMLEEEQSAAGATFRTYQLIHQLYDPHYVEVEMRPLSPEFEMEYRPVSPQPLMLTTEIKTSSPDSTTSANNFRPDSPSPQCCQLEFEERPTSGIEYEPLIYSPPDTEDRPYSPESVELEVEERPLSPESETEYRPFSPTSLTLLSNFRSSSPESTGSLNEFRTLSPDSPIPELRLVLQESLITYRQYRSSSPVSVSSDSEVELELPFSMLFEDRPSSSSSEASVTKYRRLSPDSPILQFTPALPGPHVDVSGYRSTSPESVASDVEFAPLMSPMFEVEERPDSSQSVLSFLECQLLSPDSPVPYYTHTEPSVFTGMYRSTSPESVHSDEDLETDLCILWLFEDRAASPDSAASEDEFRPLSPDSPIPEFTPALQEPSISHTDLRSSSPESEASEIEYVPLISQLFDFEGRPESCQSGEFDSDLRCFPLDSPVPQYTISAPTVLEVRYRSTSPESVHSDEDLETDMCFPWLFEDRAASPDSTASGDEFRLLTPDSPIPEFTLALQEPSISHTDLRSSSPESEASEIEYVPLISQLFDFEGRPESCQSGEFDSDLRCFPLDSPVPQYTISAPTVLEVRYRSTSPESVHSDEDLETDLCIPWLFEDRAASPDSTASGDEFRLLSPDSPIPEFTPILQEQSISHTDLRSSSPETEFSDMEMELSFPRVVEDRPSSPESLASLSKCRRLSNDSPVPDFSQAWLEPNREFKGYRSSSPESATSDIEYEPLINSPPDTEDRPYSPESVELEVEERPLSPESETEYRPFSPTSLTLLSNFRSSSPESTGSLNEFRTLSPDSPIPELRLVLQESLITYRQYRSSSPVSVSSDSEVELELPFSMLFEDRPSSSSSEASVTKYRRLSPDSPILEFTPALPGPHVDVSGYRSASPESVASDVEFAPLMSQLFEVKERPDSPQSVLSFSEYQLLSPDSPVPYYTHTEPSMFTGMYRSISPESVHSVEDLETDLCILWLFEDRALSPDSTTSGNEFRPLSPESPIPEFTPALQSTICHTDLRSTSPDSVLSDLEMELPLPTFLESRTSSPESQASVRLSPDSPVPDFMPLMFGLPETIFGHRSASPESLCSDIEYNVISLGSLVYDNRTSSPGSGAEDEYQPLSPDSPIPEYRPDVSECVIVNIGSRSPSPESIESDIEYALSEFLMSMTYGIKDRQGSPESEGSEEQERSSFDILTHMRTLSRQSERSDDECKHLPSESPIPDFTKTFVENVMTVRDISPTEFSDSDNLSQTSDLFCAEDRSASPESTESDRNYHWHPHYQ
ncbi:uncharacterized protein LOC111667980 [Seriola lalandi dorsalis]|uniref:uncharacterized protein LOC111667980 n=1 Tax=Seriola lalandi dorsalis TaxID=1841481 RepID=UPI000C6FA5B5|nr:uncharacterized protein LOC111667980 [Seriola lalandi dorsalis]